LTPQEIDDLVAFLQSRKNAVKPVATRYGELTVGLVGGILILAIGFCVWNCRAAEPSKLLWQIRKTDYDNG
jgi:hypothetical protein